MSSAGGGSPAVSAGSRCPRVSLLYAAPFGFLALVVILMLWLDSGSLGLAAAAAQRLLGTQAACKPVTVEPPPQQLATVVSGYWALPSNDRSVGEVRTDKDYASWLQHSLHIAAPALLFYGGPAEQQILSTARAGWPYPTRLVRRPLTEFHSAMLVPEEGWNATAEGYPPRPRALSLVWLEKLALLALAAAADPFGTEWFAWVDAALNLYRRRAPPCSPWPGNVTALAVLPRTACIYAHSDRGPDYIAASVLMVHRGAAEKVAAAFYASLAQCAATRNSTECGDDQAVMRLASEAYPDLFWAANGMPERRKANWGLVFTSLV